MCQLNDNKQQCVCPSDEMSMSQNDQLSALSAAADAVVWLTSAMGLGPAHEHLGSVVAWEVSPA